GARLGSKYSAVVNCFRSNGPFAWKDIKIGWLLLFFAARVPAGMCRRTLKDDQKGQAFEVITCIACQRRKKVART
ncbi:MAG: hypothetical protein WBX05_11590, partial [Pseudolabrys sp.]